MTSDECVKEFLRYAEEKQFDRALILNNGNKEPRVIMKITSYQDYISQYSDEFFNMKVSFPQEQDSFLADDMISFMSKMMSKKKIIDMIKYFMK